MPARSGTKWRGVAWHGTAWHGLNALLWQLTYLRLCSKIRNFKKRQRRNRSVCRQAAAVRPLQAITDAVPSHVQLGIILLAGGV